MEFVFEKSYVDYGGVIMKQKTYIKAIIKKIKCSKKNKIEIMKQLKSDICIALENGESLEMIITRMGTPSEVAREFNENISEIEIKSTRKSKIIMIIGIIVGILVVLGVLVHWALPKTKDIANSTIFDKEIVASQSEIIIGLLDEGAYEILIEDYADDKMNNVLTGEVLEKVKKTIDDSWGDYITITYLNMIEVVQMGKTYVVVQVNARYDEFNVTYTVIFDKDLKLAGLYMK